MQLFSLVVPMYNEKSSVDEFFSTVEPVLEEASRQYSLEYEIVVVDDGSSDGTEAALEAHVVRNPRIRAVILSRNFGKEYAVSAGLAAARGDAVVPIDADLQDPIELIFSMLERWKQGAEVVVAVQKNRDAESFAKKTTAYLFYKVFNALCRPKLPEDVRDFRLMDRRVVDAVLQLPESNRFLKGLFAWVGFKTECVYCVNNARKHGHSKWNYRKLLDFALDGITGFSSSPLRLLLWAGVTVSTLAFVYCMYVISRTLLVGESVQGYPTIMVVVLLLGGIQIIGLGILGEYLGRIYTESKKRPLYVVRRTLGEMPRASRIDPQNKLL